LEAPKTLEGKVRLRRKMEKCESTGNSSKECGPAVVGGIDIPATLLRERSADLPCLGGL
jgi:hypothetical protein